MNTIAPTKQPAYLPRIEAANPGDDSTAEVKPPLDLSRTQLPVLEGNKALQENRPEDVLEYVDAAEKKPDNSAEDKFILNEYRNFANLVIAERKAAKDRDGDSLNSATRDIEFGFLKLSDLKLPGAKDAAQNYRDDINMFIVYGVAVDLPVAEGVTALVEGDFESIINYDSRLLTDANEDRFDDFMALAQIAQEIQKIGGSSNIDSLMSNAENTIKGMNISVVDKNTISNVFTNLASSPQT
ncbi:MAG: hypothetical protein V3U76_05870 [Granulosicoccus sp.]